MALILADRVRETSTTTGTGALSLAGAVVGYQTFSSAIGNTNTCYYAISNPGVAEFEVGIGTYATSGNTLTRTTILKSSNANAAVNFSAGTKDVFVTYPAEKAVYLDASGNVTLAGGLGVGGSAAPGSTGLAVTGTGTFSNTVTVNTTNDALQLQSAATNASVINLGVVASTYTYLQTAKIGTGTTRPFRIYSDSTQIAEFSSTGLAVTGTLSATSSGSFAQPSSGNTGLTVNSFGLAGGNQPLGTFKRNDSAISIEIGYDGGAGNSHVGTTTAHDFEIWRGGSIKATATSTGLAVTGTLSATGAISGATLSANGAVNFNAGTINTSGGGANKAIYFSAATNVMYSGSSDWYIRNQADTVTIITATNAGAVTIPGTLTVTGAGSIEGLTVGRGAGASSTNTVVGALALASSGATFTTAIGYQASQTLTGSFNTAVGHQAMVGATPFTANRNDAFGYAALSAVTSGAYNSALGFVSLASNTTGSFNVAVGPSALQSNTTASNNTAVGYQAGYTNTTGAQNTDVGMKAGYLGTTRTYTTSMGYFAGYSSNGTLNTYIGYASGPNNGTASVESYNTGIGAQALNGTTTASNNTAVGYQAAYTNTTGTGNVAFGKDALRLNNTTSNNTAVGTGAGKASTGSENTFIGSDAGETTTTGTFNAFLGRLSGYLVTSGGKNTIIGSYTGNSGGLDIRTASNHIVLSDGDGNPRGIFDSSGNLLVGGTSLVSSGKISVTFSQSSNQGVSLKNSSAGNAANYILFVNSADAQSGIIAQTGATSVVYTTTSDYRLKKNQEPLTNSGIFIDALKPKTWEWVADGSKASGFIAHEFSKISPLSVSGEKDATREEEYEISPAIPATFDGEGNELTAAVDAVKGNKTVPVYQSMQASSSEVMANIVAELQSLRKRITALENK